MLWSWLWFISVLQDLQDNWHSEHEDSHKADGLILLGYCDYLDYQKNQLIRGVNRAFCKWEHGPNHTGVSVSSNN